jgi:hypothetical protein
LVQFTPEISKPWTGPKVWFSQACEIWTGPLIHVQQCPVQVQSHLNQKPNLKSKKILILSIFGA